MWYCYIYIYIYCIQTLTFLKSSNYWFFLHLTVFPSSCMTLKNSGCWFWTHRWVLSRFFLSVGTTELKSLFNWKWIPFSFRVHRSSHGAGVWCFGNDKYQQRGISRHSGATILSQLSVTLCWRCERSDRVRQEHPWICWSGSKWSGEIHGCLRCLFMFMFYDYETNELLPWSLNTRSSPQLFPR